MPSSRTSIVLGTRFREKGPAAGNVSISMPFRFPRPDGNSGHQNTPPARTAGSLGWDQSSSFATRADFRVFWHALNQQYGEVVAYQVLGQSVVQFET